MSDATRWAYIGRTQTATKHGPAGTSLCVMVDRPEWAKDTAKAVARWIRDGLTIERVPVAWAREHFGTTARYVAGDVA